MQNEVTDRKIFLTLTLHSHFLMLAWHLQWHCFYSAASSYYSSPYPTRNGANLIPPHLGCDTGLTESNRLDRRSTSSHPSNPHHFSFFCATSDIGHLQCTLARPHCIICVLPNLQVWVQEQHKPQWLLLRHITREHLCLLPVSTTSCPSSHCTTHWGEADKPGGVRVAPHAQLGPLGARERISPTSVQPCSSAQ